MDKDKIIKELFIGSIMLVLLLIIMSPGSFFIWVELEFFAKAVSIFFILPIVYILVDGFPKEIIVVFVIGSLLFILYMLYYSLDFQEISILLLQTVVEILIISSLLAYLKKGLEKKIPP